jgi:hypothetical protein
MLSLVLWSTDTRRRQIHESEASTASGPSGKQRPSANATISCERSVRWSLPSFGGQSGSRRHPMGLSDAFVHDLVTGTTEARSASTRTESSVPGGESFGGPDSPPSGRNVVNRKLRGPCRLSDKNQTWDVLSARRVAGTHRADQRLPPMVRGGRRVWSTLCSPMHRMVRLRVLHERCEQPSSRDDTRRCVRLLRIFDRETPDHVASQRRLGRS